MYVLKQVEGVEIYYLIGDKEYTIGRKGANITINDDQSISRKHAIIKIQKNLAFLQDCGSKYGTSHNESKLDPQNQVPLENNDTIRFGICKSIYKIEKVNVATTGSGLTNEQKSQLKNKMSAVGGSFLNNWDASCTHITAQELMLTIKMLHGIVSGIPIVTLAFWDKFEENVKNMKPPPDCTDFKPPISESFINEANLSPNSARRELFKNKTFVFATEKIRLRIAILIEQIGGKSISWEKQPLTLLQITKSKNNYLFIQPNNSKDVPQSLQDIYQRLTKLGERIIPIQEIARSIVFCSCEKDCNPKFNKVHNIFVDQEMCTNSEQCLAGETESDDILVQKFEPKQEIIVPQSLEEDLFVPIQRQEPCSDLNRGNVFAGPSTSSSGAKRGEQEEPTGSLCKKIKLSTTSKKDHQPNKSIILSQPISRKRKADENLEPTSRKTFLKPNPFAISRSKDSHKATKSNPFAVLKMEKENNTDSDNPFMVMRDQNSNEQSTVDSCSLNLSFSQDNCPSDASKIQWLTREGIKTQTLQIEPDLCEIYEKFKNSVILEVMPATAFRSLDASQNITINSTQNGKNFKKFKKVCPLKPQINIITTSVLSKTIKRENTVTSDEEEEDEEEKTPRPSLEKNYDQSRFVF